MDGAQRMQTGLGRWALPCRFGFLAKHLLNLSERVHAALIASGAAFRSPSPTLRAGYIRVPKRPSPALPRSVFVNAATPRVRVQENAVSVGVFHQASACTDTPHELVLEAIDIVDSHPCGEFRDLRIIDPDEAAARAAAAVTTTRAFERQSASVPHIAFDPIRAFHPVRFRKARALPGFSRRCIVVIRVGRGWHGERGAVSVYGFEGALASRLK